MSVSVSLPAAAGIWRRFGLWRCSRGHHAKPLTWRRKDRYDAARVASLNPAAEMFAASGLMGLAKWIGVCPRCDRMVEWADHDPRSSIKVRWTA